MKLTKHLLMASALTISLTACQQEEFKSDSTGNAFLSINISKANLIDADTRTTLSEENGDLNCKWTAGDKILVTDANGGKKGVLTIMPEYAGTEQGKFNGELSGVKEGVSDFNFIYLGTSVSNPAAISNPHAQSYAIQKGSLESLSEKDIFTSTTPVEINDGIAIAEDMMLERKIAFAHFELIFPSGVNYSGETVTISGTDLNNTLNLELTNSVSYTAGDIKVAGKDFYITMLPGTVSNLDFTVSIGDMKYKGSLGEHEWKAGEFVRQSDGVGVPVIMEELEPEPENPGDMGNWGGNENYPSLITLSTTKHPSSEGWAENTRVNVEDFGFTPVFEYTTNAIKDNYLTSASYSDGSEAKYFQWGRWLGFPSEVVYATVNMLAYNYNSRYAKYPRGINPNSQIRLYYCWDMDSRPTYAYSAQVSRWTPQIARNSSIIFGVNTTGNKDYLPGYNLASDTWESRSGNPCPDGYRIPTKAELEVFVPSCGTFNGSYAEVKVINGKRYAMRWSVSGNTVTVLSAETSQESVTVNDPVFNNAEGVTLEAAGMVYGQSGSALFATSFNGGYKMGGYWSSESARMDDGSGYGAWCLMISIKGNSVEMGMEVDERSLGLCVLPIRDRNAKSDSCTPYFPLGY